MVKNIIGKITHGEVKRHKVETTKNKKGQKYTRTFIDLNI